MTTPEQLAEQIAAGRRGELADFDLVAMIRQYTAEIEAKGKRLSPPGCGLKAGNP